METSHNFLLCHRSSRETVSILQDSIAKPHSQHTDDDEGEDWDEVVEHNLPRDLAIERPRDEIEEEGKRDDGNKCPCCRDGHDSAEIWLQTVVHQSDTVCHHDDHEADRRGKCILESIYHSLSFAALFNNNTNKIVNFFQSLHSLTLSLHLFFSGHEKYVKNKIGESCEKRYIIPAKTFTCTPKKKRNHDGNV